MLRWEPHPFLKPPTDEEVAVMEPEELLEVHRLYHEAIDNERRDPLRFGLVLPQWRVGETLLNQEDTDELWIFGGNRCYCPSTTYVFDPVLGSHRLAGDIDGPFHVYAYDHQSDRVVIALANKPYKKGHEEMFQVTLDSGDSICVTAQHRFLMADGRYQSLADCRVGDQLMSLSLQTDGDQTRILSSCDAPDYRRVQDSQFDYLSDFRSCGEQPLRGQGTDPGASPLQDDALIRSHDHTRLGDAGRKSICSRHPSSDGGSFQRFVSHASCISFGLCCKAYKFYQRSLGVLRHWLPARGSHRPAPVSTGDSSCVWADFADSVYPILTVSPDQLGEQSPHTGCRIRSVPKPDQCYSVGSCLQVNTITRISSIGKSEVWDHHVPGYENYYANGAFHHNSSKSKFASWLIMQSLLENPGTRVFCWSQNDEASKLNQQPYFWDYLPLEYRKKQRGQTTKIVYSKANGFTDKNFILPNGSQCIFKTYSQFLNDPSVIEGAELGAKRGVDGYGYLNIGNWFDEYLLGPDLLETMRPRLATRDALNLITFTPIDGYTETVRQILAGAKTEETRPAELLNGELVPVVQQPKRRNSKILYFHTDLNPYSGYNRLKRDLEGASREHILVRAYGVPTKSATGKFPRFTREHNVMKHTDLPFEKDPAYKVTRYLVVDPAPVKPWAMAWIAVDPAGVHYVYREWPDIGYGEWGEWGKNDRSRPGPAAKANGYGIRDYVDLMRQMEEGEEIAERFIDSRMGNTARQKAEGSSTMIDDLNDEGLIFYPAPGLDEEEGLQQLQNLIAWDSERPLDALNRTHLIVSDQCEQTIMCLQEYTGKEGKNEAWKDFVDVLRYAATANLEYLDAENVIPVTTGGY